MLLRLLIFVLFVTAMNVFSQTPPIETGVSQGLAKWRAANYSDVRYKLNITLEKGAPLMRGEIEIRVNLTDEGAKNDLILDWRTTQFANDKDKPFANVVTINDKSTENQNETFIFLRDEHLIISKPLLKTGENVIKINFASPIKTSGAAITRYVDKEDGAEYVYSLFVPSYASTAFPVFDQPDLKARFSLRVDIPSGWKIVSNTKGRGYRFDNFDTPHYSFEETKPISTYVFAFAAGDFAEFKEEEFNNLRSDIIQDPIIKQSDIDALPYKFGKPKATKEKPKDESKNNADKDSKLQSDTVSNNRETSSKIYVRKSQAEKFKQHAAEVFRLNREGVKFLESWFDYKFPFPKYDLVLIPEFPFGGMEHAGATFLREDRVIFPTEPTKNDFITRANVIFHEAAHQWFGDTVTMKWFDDLWLKEGFAEFMAYKTLEKVMPEYNAWKIFYERNKQAAYLTDVTRGTTPIYQEIPNLSAAKSAYGNIVYRKAPSFLRQAEFYLGEDKFQTAVRAFLKKHEYANAEWTDLVKEFELASKQYLKDWGENWVKQAGLFKLHLNLFRSEYTINLNIGEFAIQADSKQTWKIRFNQAMKFNVLLLDNDGTKTVRNYQPISLENEIPVYKSLILRNEPVFIFPNYQDYGYGIFLLDEKSRAYVLENIQNEKDDFLRSMMWGSLWDSLRFYELAPEDYVKLVIKNINTETDESTIQTLLGRVSTAMNYYLSDTQATELAPQVEAVLIDKMQNAPTLGQRITFYRAFLNLASSDKAAAILKDVLNGKLQIKDLQLKTKDRYDILTRLVILNDKDAPRLSLKELEKNGGKASDEERRYGYAKDAGINSAANKKEYFDDFINDKTISESWIESALVTFNSPRRADLTLPYLQKALAELPNLKKNRKIFFVNGWLSAFIGGQRSDEALAIVNKFLADNPNLDKDLRLKILENTDGLERAVKIRRQFAK